MKKGEGGKRVKIKEEWRGDTVRGGVAGGEVKSESMKDEKYC